MGTDCAPLTVHRSGCLTNPISLMLLGVNPGKENQKECPLALVSVYYDVLDHISIDSSINHTKASERACAAMHLNYAQPDDLSILDRGYNAFWALCEAKNQSFCMRAKINRGKQYNAFASSGKTQTVIR